MIALNNLARRTGEKWPAAERDRAVALTAKGFDAAAVAAILDKTEHGVKVVLKNAADRAAADAGKKPRRCLGGCGASFMSEGPHNRVCRGCSGRRHDLGEAYQLGRL